MATHRVTRKARGGFIPSVMGGVMRVGPYLTTAAVAQGSRLLSRSRSKSRRRHGTRRAKRSRRRI